MGSVVSTVLVLGVPAAIAVVLVLVLRMRSDLRRFGNAIWLAVASCSWCPPAARWGCPGSGGSPWLRVLLGVLSPVLLVVLIVTCLANGVVMLRREGARLGNLLSLLLGLGMVALVALVALLVQAVAIRSVVLIALTLFGVLAAGYFAFVFVSLVLYAFVYSVIVRRMLLTHPVGAVVVLGSGLKNGDEVTPLLRGRIEEGLRVVATAARFQRRPCW